MGKKIRMQQQIPFVESNSILTKTKQNPPKIKTLIGCCENAMKKKIIFYIISKKEIVSTEHPPLKYL